MSVLYYVKHITLKKFGTKLEKEVEVSYYPLIKADRLFVSRFKISINGNERRKVL